MRDNNQPYKPAFKYEIQISEPKDTEGRMSGIYGAFDWLSERGYKPDKDYVVDMHGGLRTYCSLWFRDKDTAMMIKLAIGG
jgi:hypothetical protein